ncbi:MAG: hypothetical protein K2I21_05970 [Acetatifactor sp.]|nr:hypothetical protein [Acetatifactor sp.]
MKINPRELEILKILHSSDQALTITQIVNAREELTQSIVQTAIRRLLAAELIDVQGITYSGNVLSRRFGPTEKSREVIFQRFLDSYRDYKCIIGFRTAVEGMLEIEEDKAKRGEDIEALVKLLAEMKANG